MWKEESLRNLIKNEKEIDLEKIDLIDDFSWIGETAPCISVPADNVKIIIEPKEFYSK